MPVYLIPEHPSEVGGGRLGRHVHHDPRSLAYRFEPEYGAGPVTVQHNRRVGVFDQGNLGSCTGNAILGAVGTDPLFDPVPVDNPDRPNDNTSVDEDIAVKLYEQATQLDDVPGTYPPDDTGSTGLAAAKAAQQAGLISGYQHALSLQAALAALALGPITVGVNWYSSFDNPAADGHITLTSGAYVRGGHEFVIDGCNVAKRIVWAYNSWGPGWGANGRMYFSWDLLGRLLSEQGDATVPVPLSTPPPTPTPTPTPDPADLALVQAQAAWRKAKGL